MAVAAAGLVAACAVLAVTGVHLNDLYSEYRSCESFTCNGAFNAVADSNRHVKLIGSFLIGLPALIGIFWGAPLVSREIENGTYRLAWTQSVTRTRWISSKIAVAAAASAVTAGVFTFAVTWWAIPFDRLGANRVDPGIFNQRGIAPVAYALFAFALGAAAGVVLRRTIPAIAVTLVGFVTVRMLTQYFLRPHLLAPLHRMLTLGPGSAVGIQRSAGGVKVVDLGRPQFHGAWVLGSKLVDSAGHTPTSAVVRQACRQVIESAPPPTSRSGVHRMQVTPEAMRAMESCVSNLGARYREVVSYQPESRFWDLQLLESAIFVGLAVALIGLTVYWVRRRLV